MAIIMCRCSDRVAITPKRYCENCKDYLCEFCIPECKNKKHKLRVLTKNERGQMLIPQWQ